MSCRTVFTTATRVLAVTGSPAAAIAVAVLAAIVAAGCLVGPLDYDGRDFDTMFGLFLAVWIVGGALRWGTRFPFPGRVVQVFALFGALSLLATLASAVLGVGDRPYLDDTLDLVDRTMAPGFDWAQTMRRLPAHPWLLGLLSHAYVSLNWQPALLFGAIALRNANGQLRRFMLAWSIALLACIVPFHWLPAHGGYVHYGIAFDALPGMRVHLPWQYPPALDALRAGRISMLDVHVALGLVTVPSFHACAAVLLGWAFAHDRLLRWPLVPLNVAMLVSAVPIGGHYLADIVAGALVAAAAIALAGRLDRVTATSVAAYRRAGTGPPVVASA